MLKLNAFTSILFGSCANWYAAGTNYWIFLFSGYRYHNQTCPPSTCRYKHLQTEIIGKRLIYTYTTGATKNNLSQIVLNAKWVTYFANTRNGRDFMRGRCWTSRKGWTLFHNSCILTCTTTLSTLHSQGKSATKTNERTELDGPSNRWSSNE